MPSMPQTGQAGGGTATVDLPVSRNATGLDHALIDPGEPAVDHDGYTASPLPIWMRTGPETAVIDVGLGDVVGEPPAWQERGLCAQTDPEAFFPEKGGSTREAKRICLGCEVRAECLDYALANDEAFGVWGGMSERERRRYKRRAH